MYTSLVHNMYANSGGGSHLLMGFHWPVVFDLGVTEIADLLEHGSHEGGAKLLGAGGYLVPLLVNQVLPNPSVVVECWKTVKELTATLHVPTVQGGGHTRTTV